MHFVSIALHRSHPCWWSRLLVCPLKRTPRKCLCPGCKLATPAHDFGLLNNFYTGRGTEESEDGAEAIDTAKASLISAQCNPVQPTAELLQAVRWLFEH